MRRAQVLRNTLETQISINLNLDGTGKSVLETGVPFLDHMLELFTQHGLFDLTVRATGDIAVDYHHTVEDIGIALGECLKKALGDCKGIRRYGEATVPMDESLSTVVLDICNRPGLVYDTPALRQGTVGTFDVELVKEFFGALAKNSGMALHIKAPYGENAHHIIEAIFKAFARALDMATMVDERIVGVMSTKGKL